MVTASFPKIPSINADKNFSFDNSRNSPSQ